MTKSPPRSRSIFYGALATPLALVALIRFLPFQTPYPFLAIESLAFWLLLPAYVLGAIAFARGHRRIGACLGLVALVHLAWTFDWLLYVEDGATHSPLVRIVDANLLAPRPTDALADEVLGADADVLTLQEVSIEWLATLDARGAREAYPYRIVDAHALDQDYFGVAILSRRPLVDARIETLPGGVPMARADLVIDGHALRLYSIHTAPPATPGWGAMWLAHLDALEARLRQDVAASEISTGAVRRADPTQLRRPPLGGTPVEIVVAAGDFNLSPFSFAHRRLRALGLSEAHEAVGRGLAWTWPNGIFGAPPMRLDHAYVHGAVVRSVRELPALSSDHSPLVIELGAR